MDRKQPLSRRQFLALAATGAATSLITACASPPQAAPTAPATAGAASTAAPTLAAPTAAPTTAAATPAASAGAYREAPMLARMVEQGVLPAVDARLPLSPVVVEPVERIGVYGGSWRAGVRGSGDSFYLNRNVGYEHLVRWTPDWSGVAPNVAESYESNAEGTAYTFTLREGMRWSDGEPFTADDVLFWWEDVALNEELSPSGPPAWMRVGDAVGSVEKVDTYTVRFSFPAPNGLLLLRMATGDGAQVTGYPRHYVEQFHQKYNPDGIAALIAEAQATDWVNLFDMKVGIAGDQFYVARAQNLELPTLWAWRLTRPYTAGTRVTYERNPYYWKVDPENQQLPYIDTVVFDQFEDVPAMVLQGLNGDLDMQSGFIDELENKAVFSDNQEQGEYRFFDKVEAQPNMVTFALNLAHKDPVKRAIYQNKDFRIGLSHAINRQEIIDLLLVGEGEPYQVAPLPSSQFYNEQLARQYLEFNPDLANEHLDKAGLTERNSDGLRLGPDGQPVAVAMMLQTGDTLQISAFELINRYWRDVGIDGQLQLVERSLWGERRDANEFDAGVWGAGGALALDVILDPRYYMPYNRQSFFAVPWAYWYEGREGGEEPPENVRRQLELYDELKLTVDPAEQQRLMGEILQIAADEFYMIGVSLPPNTFGIVKNNFHNVPAVMPMSSAYPTPAPTNPFQYFIEE